MSSSSFKHMAIEQQTTISEILIINDQNKLKIELKAYFTSFKLFLSTTSLYNRLLLENQ